MSTETLLQRAAVNRKESQVNNSTEEPTDVPTCPRDDDDDANAAAIGSNQNSSRYRVFDAEDQWKTEIGHRLMEYVDRVCARDLNTMMQYEVVDRNQRAVIDLFADALDAINDLFSPKNVLVMKRLQMDSEFMHKFFLPKLKLFIRDFEMKLSRHRSTYVVTTRDRQQNQVTRARHGEIRRGWAVEWAMYSHLRLARIIYRGFSTDPSLLDTIRPNVMVLSFDVAAARRPDGKLPKISLASIPAFPDDAPEAGSPAKRSRVNDD